MGSTFLRKFPPIPFDPLCKPKGARRCRQTTQPPLSQRAARKRTRNPGKKNGRQHPIAAVLLSGGERGIRTPGAPLRGAHTISSRAHSAALASLRNIFHFSKDGPPWGALFTLRRLLPVSPPFVHTQIRRTSPGRRAKSTEGNRHGIGGTIRAGSQRRADKIMAERGGFEPP